MPAQPHMQDQELMTDCLTSQKTITGGYNTFANECADGTLRQTVMQLLQEEHDIQFDVFRQMQSRGWYPTPAAPRQKVQQVKTKYQNMAAQG